MKIDGMDQHFYQECVTKKRIGFRVHSVFESAVNLISQEGIWATVVSKGRWLPPNGFRVKNFPELKERLKQEDSFWMDENILPDKLIDLHIHRITEKPEQRESMEILEKKVEYLQEYLNIFGKEGFMRKPLPEKIQLSLTAFDQGLDNQDEERVKDSLQGLIGFGKGLTPSMDDYLAARILVWKIWKQIYPIKETIHFGDFVVDGAVQKTTVVSERMLQFANQGRCSEDLLRLFRMMFLSSKGPEYEDAIKEVMEIGGSSGEDWIYGIIKETKRLLVNRKGGNNA
ncbi:DUF2877 domain-containing protein [Tindallia californiensis]|uniref:DUF2877 domain-containing protein n=1 Tax=Tindallia californiensis TaxID=159292 RepID=A0A1H3PTB4_9FIRM|nr:DUF2877 domain-containing protein [Tindallia californiensis]SDZ04178.1 Protein of unknown function [Tindallia californiensis]